MLHASVVSLRENHCFHCPILVDSKNGFEFYFLNELKYININ